MKALLFALTLAASAAPTLSGAAFARVAQQQQHLIGEVTAVSQDGGRITVKTDAGATVEVAVDEKTVYRRALPGQTSLRDAEPATRADVRAGDRVLVPNGGALAAGAAARQVVLMAREAVAERRERERDDWRRRGLTGRVAAINAAKKEITVEARGRGEAETIVVSAAADKVRFRRHAPDSLRPADAVSGSFADIRVGDQVRVLGEREAANSSRVVAEEILSGSVARLSGAVESVDAARGVVTLKDARTNQLVSVALGQRTTLRRLPEEFAAALRERREQRRAARAEGEANERRRGEGRGRQEGEGAGGRRREGGGGLDSRRGLEDLPAITLAELKRGDAVMVTATYGADASRLTAVSLVTGDAETISRMGRPRRRERDDVSTGLPGGVMGGNTGEQQQQRRNEP